MEIRHMKRRQEYEVDVERKWEQLLAQYQEYKTRAYQQMERARAEDERLERERLDRKHSSFLQFAKIGAGRGWLLYQWNSHWSEWFRRN